MVRKALTFLTIALLSLTPSASASTDADRQFQDSLSFESFLVELEVASSSYADRTITDIELAFNETNRAYPDLYVELLRQYLQAGLYARRHLYVLDRFEAEKDSLTARWTNPYYRMALEALLFRLDEVPDHDRMMEFAALRDSILSSGHESVQPYFNLILRTVNRAYIHFCSTGQEFGTAIEVSLENLDVEVPSIYARTRFYDIYRLGIMYDRLGDREASEEFFNKTLEEIGEPGTDIEADIWARAYHFIGIHSRSRGDTVTWVANTRKAIDIMSNHGSQNLCPPLLDMADYHFTIGNLDSAMFFVQEAESTLQGNPDYMGYNTAGVKVYYARYYASMGDYETAIEYMLEAKKYDTAKGMMKQIYSLLPQYYAELGDYTKAYEVSQEFQDMYSELINEQAIRKAERDRARYDLAQKESERALFEERERQVTDKYKLQRMTLVLALLLISILLVLAYKSIRSSRNLRELNSRLKEQAIELSAARDVAEDASKAKTEFLSVMSHEIRTPLNAMIGMNEALLLDDPRDDQKKALEMASKASKHLLTLINDILDFNKLSTGRVVLHEHPVDLKVLCREMADLAGILVQGKDLSLNTYMYENVPPIVVIDDIRLRQVLTNLLTNAVKFTEKGSVELFAEADLEKGRIYFIVRDTGIGIPEDAQEQIFEAYTQASGSITGRYGGTGLGLSISKELVELMGGKICVQSSLAQGSTFTVDLPLVIADKEVDSRELAHIEEEEFAGLKFLVAEDNELNLAVIQMILDRWKVHYEVARNGIEAVAMMQDDHYDLVLMDVHMPDLDGLEATRRIRSGAVRSSEVPIIALTASGLEREIRKMNEVGMNGHVLKPIDTYTLLYVIRKHLPKRVV